MTANGKNIDGIEKCCTLHKPLSRMEYMNVRRGI